MLFALRRVGWKRFLAAGALGAVICVTWFVPLMVLGGGISNYMRTVGTFTRRFQSTTSVLRGGGWWGVGRNVRKLTMYTLFGWGTALVPALVYVVRAAGRMALPHPSPLPGGEGGGPTRMARYERSIFLLLWIAPVVIFYAVIHMGQQGLVFVFLPALLLPSAVGLARLLDRRPSDVLYPRWLVAVAAVLVVLNAGVFCLVPEYPLGPDNLRLLTRAALVNTDRYYQDRFAAIEGNFAPESTAILAANWHHVEYYLPDYPRLPFGVVSKWEKDEGSPIGSSLDVVATPAELGLQLDGQGQAVIVVFDPYLMAFSDSQRSVRGLALKHGGELGYFVLTEEQAFHYGAASFGVVVE